MAAERGQAPAAVTDPVAHAEALAPKLEALSATLGGEPDLSFV